MVQAMPALAFVDVLSRLRPHLSTDRCSDSEVTCNTSRQVPSPLETKSMLAQVPSHVLFLVLITAFLEFPDSMSHNSFKCFVTKSTLLFGAGPTPITVALPAAICVLPASCIIRAQIPKLMAVACRVSNSSSLFTCTATFACPYRSHRRIRLCAAGLVFGIEDSAL